MICSNLTDFSSCACFSLPLSLSSAHSCTPISYSGIFKGFRRLYITYHSKHLPFPPQPLPPPRSPLPPPRRIHTSPRFVSAAETSRLISTNPISHSPFAVISPIFSPRAKLRYIVFLVALEVSMLICFSELAAAASNRNDAGKTYVTISRPFPAA